MADYATTADVEALWRPLTPAEVARATRMLGYATRMIREQLPGVQVRIDAGALDPELVRDVTASMVRRAMSNPDGIRQEAAGSLSLTYDSAVSTGLIYLTPDELRLLSGTAATGGYGTILVGSPFL